MISADGRYVMSYNGEIYNYKALRAEFEARGRIFKTQSDSEVVLEGFACDGPNILERLRGMFSIAIWDTLHEKLFLARDPYGIKPLYYARIAEGFLVASQVKALLRSGLVSREPNLRGQASYWLLGSIPEPHTWFKNIGSVRAGHLVVIGRNGIERESCWCDISQWWTQAQGRERSYGDVLRAVSDALKRSVQLHLVSDVPVGIFLSGGIDSTALAALCSQVDRRPLTGVTLSFPEFNGTKDDEAALARRAATEYGIAHHVREITFDEFKDDLSSIFSAMDQPTVDGVNTWYASKALAECGVKVALSGVGGDELFQGYSTFRQLPRLIRLWRLASKSSLATAGVKQIAEMRAKRSANQRWRLLPEALMTPEGAWFVRRGLFAPEELWKLMGYEAADEVMPCLSYKGLVNEIVGRTASDLPLALGQIESLAYLRNQLLRDSDWASMDHSLELRAPLVDATLLKELSPVLAAFSRFPNKKLLIEAAHNRLPREIAHRRKTGFNIPVQRWLHKLGLSAGHQGMSRAWASQVVINIYSSVHC
jgi:asparagine synthase (glutamine-hydrolysing)